MEQTNQYSYSVIRLWRTCPLAYSHKRKRTPTEETKPLLTGSLGHSVYEMYTKWCVEHARATDLDAAPALARKAFEVEQHERRRKRRAYPLTDVDFDEVYRDLVQPFLDSHMVDLKTFADAEMQVAVNGAFEEVGWFDDDVWFRAVIDLLEFPEPERARITDYKTGWNTDVDDLQMEVYAWILFGLYPGVQEVECVLDFTRFNIQKRTIYIRDPDAERIDVKVRELVARIEADTALAPTPGPHCLTCQYAHVCNAKVEPLLNGISTAEGAQKAVENISLLEAHLKREKDQLREWCKEHGNVTHNHVCWGQHAVGGLGFDNVGNFLEAAILDEVENPSRFLNVDGTRVKKLMKDGAFPEHLAAVAVNKRTVRFEGKKA